MLFGVDERGGLEWRRGRREEGSCERKERERFFSFVQLTLSKKKTLSLSTSLSSYLSGIPCGSSTSTIILTSSSRPLLVPQLELT